MSARMLGAYVMGFLRSHGGNKVAAAEYARAQMDIDTDGREFWRTVALYVEAM